MYFYDEKTHTYWMNDRQLPSVTQMIHSITNGFFKTKAIPPYYLKKACEKGVEIHQKLEKYYKDKPETIATEKKLFCPAFAGTIDLLIKKNDELWLIDFKTCNISQSEIESKKNQKGMVYLYYFKAQLWFYKQLLIFNGLDCENLKTAIMLIDKKIDYTTTEEMVKSSKLIEMAV